ncbi:MAG: flagellar biosynthetic protein FliR [Planctomycetaceae bacterium]
MPQLTVADVSLLLSPWTAQLVTFALVLSRVGGLLSVGPLLGRAILPWPIRVGLAVVLSLLLVPLVGSSKCTTFEKTTFVPAVATEFSKGFLLGCGSLLILWVLPLAGRLLDQQHALPSDDDDDDPLAGSPITRWLTLWGTTAFLLCSPINGHLQAVRVLADSFHASPIGSTTGLLDANVAAQLLQQSSQLALLLIAPALATLALINLALGLLGAAGLQGVPITLGNTARSLAAVVVLTLNLSGIQQTVADYVRDGITIATDVAPSH